MAVNGRRKGSAAEREICKLFSMWWNGTFQRRSLGIAGSDIVTPDGFPWALEVKHVKTMKTRHLWKPTADLVKFWKQACDQAAIEDRDPLLVAKIEGAWFVIQQMRGVMLTKEDNMVGTIDGIRVIIQTIDGFMLDAERVRDAQLAKKAA